MEKRCRDCGKTKPVEQMSKRTNYNQTDTIYYSNICIDCATVRAQEWRQKNRQKYTDYQREYQRRKRERENAKSD